MNIPAFVLATSLLAIVPGQGMAMVLRQSLLGGTKAAFLSVLGNSTGLVTWGALSAVGLSAVFASNPTAYAVLKWAGVAFLFFLAGQTAWQLRKAAGKFDIAIAGNHVNEVVKRAGALWSLRIEHSALVTSGIGKTGGGCKTLT